MTVVVWDVMLTFVLFRLLVAMHTEKCWVFKSNRHSKAGKARGIQIYWYSKLLLTFLNRRTSVHGILSYSVDCPPKLIVCTRRRRGLMLHTGTDAHALFDKSQFRGIQVGVGGVTEADADVCFATIDCMGLLPDTENCAYACAGNAGNVFPATGGKRSRQHHGTCVTHVPWCMPGSLTCGFLWSRRRVKTVPAFPAHAQPAMLRI